MAWITPAESDLVTGISGAELEAFRAAVLAAGQVDPVAPSMAQATKLIRGRVAACPRNRVEDDEAMIPPELLAAWVDIAVALVIKRVPGQELGETKQKAHDNAMGLLKDVANCKFVVSAPDTTETGLQTGGSIEVVTKPERQTSRDKLSGL